MPLHSDKEWAVVEVCGVYIRVPRPIASKLKVLETEKQKIERGDFHPLKERPKR